MIEEALRHYDFSDPSAELIRHNENMTYRVGGRYLLRIHKHIEGFSTAPLYDSVDRAEICRGELRFLEHLKDRGLHVQAPVRNKNGELVTVLQNGTPVTVLTWLEGRTIDKSDLTPERSHEIGMMTGRLHMAARGYRDHRLIRYDHALCERMIELLAKLRDSDRMTAQYCDSMTAALTVIGDYLLKTEPEFILVHSDLSLSNMLITEDGLAPIDFSLLGYSHPLLDIGGLYGCIADGECRLAMVEGYEAVSGGKLDRDTINKLFALQVLLGIVIHHELWSEKDWFEDKLGGWCREIFEPLIARTAGGRRRGASGC